MFRLSQQGRRDERGAVLMMSAVLSSVFVVLAAFAVDLGMQRVARRDMQAVADVIALDMARQLDGTKTTAALKASADWNNALTQSRDRNKDTVGEAPSVTAELGTLSTAGAFQVTPENVVPTAVRVIASSSVDFSFRGGEGGAVRTAIASATSSACLLLGSYAAAIDSGRSALLAPIINAALGGSVNTTVVGYQGLADVSISLLDLVGTELGAGTVEELLALEGVALRDFYLATATALERNGNTAEANLLETIAVTAAPIGTIDVADLVSVSSEDDAALSTALNVFDLVAGSAFLSNGDHFISVPALNASLPLLGTSAVVSLSVIEKPTPCKRVGETLETSQVRVRISGTIASINVLGLVGTNIPVTIEVNLARATGSVTSIHCNSGTVADPDTVGVTLNSDLAGLSLDAGPITLRSLGLPVLSLRTHAATVSGNLPKTAVLQYPQNANTPISIGAEQPLPGVTTTHTNVQVLGLLTLPLDNVLNAVTNVVVNPLVTQLNSLITTTLNPLLGLTLAGADAYVLGRPSCTNPKLRG